ILAGSSDSTEVWLAKHNLHLVGYGDASVMLGFNVSELDPKLLIERLLKQEDRGEAIVDIDEPEEKSEPITVTVSYPQSSRSENWKKVFHIDQANRLVKKIDKYKLRDQQFQHVKTLEFLDYNQPIDQKMFTLTADVPSDAQVVDVTDVEAGLLQGDMTEEEVAVEITRQFFEAVIAKNFSRAGELYLAAPDFLVEEAFMGANMVKIVSLGSAYPDTDPDSDSMICSCKAVAEFGGQYYDVNAFRVQVKRVDEDTNCWLISGTSISASPASDTMTLSTDSPDLNSATYDGLEGGEFLRKWLVLGPLPYPVQDDIYFSSKEGQKVAFDTDPIDFLNFTPKVKIDNADYEWTAVESKYGIVDLNQLSKEKNDFNIVYAWARIEMPEDTIATLGIGSNDGVKVWLNGDLVHENWLYRNTVSDNDRAPVTLKKGTNHLVLKVQNAMGPWGFCCRLLDE
ncbi:MAG: PA14 domain-containing protein, partial [Planctomycetota bacterium]